MVNHKTGSNYSFSQLVHAYNAEVQSDTEGYVLLCKGEDILAVCLRAKTTPKLNEIWVRAEPAAAEWGSKLAALKEKKTLPVYYRPRGRTLYEFKGLHVITGDTDDAQETGKRKSSVPLSRVVFISPVESSSRFTEAKAAVRPA